MLERHEQLTRFKARQLSQSRAWASTTYVIQGLV
jgi:hypothetical protein